jgi:hypothetical protein
VQRGDGLDEDTVFYVGADGTGFMRTMLLFERDRPASIITKFDWVAEGDVLRATTRPTSPDIPPSSITASVRDDGVLVVRPKWRPGVEIELPRVADNLTAWVPKEYVGIWSGGLSKDGAVIGRLDIWWLYLRMGGDGTGSLTIDANEGGGDWVRTETPLSWAEGEGCVNVTLAGQKEPGIVATLSEGRLVVRFADGSFPQRDYVKVPAVPREAGGR